MLRYKKRSMHYPEFFRSIKHQTKQNVYFYIGSRSKSLNILNTLPRSGWNTLKAAIASGYCYENDLPGSIFYHNNKYITIAGGDLFGELDHRSLYQKPFFYHTHKPLGYTASPVFSRKKYFGLVREPIGFTKSFLLHSYKKALQESDLHEEINRERLSDILKITGIVDLYSSFCRSLIELNTHPSSHSTLRVKAIETIGFNSILETAQSVVSFYELKISQGSLKKACEELEGIKTKLIESNASQSRLTITPLRFSTDAEGLIREATQDEWEKILMIDSAMT